MIRETISRQAINRGNRRGRATDWAAALRGERGSSLVEYAVIFTIFMTMLLGVADFGRLMYAYHFVSGAAREATRYAAVNGSTCANDGSCTSPATTSTIKTFVQNVPIGLDSTLVSCPTCSSNANTWPVVTGGPSVCTTTYNAPGCTVRVQVSYAFSFVVPIVSKLVNGGSAITLTSTSQMIISH